MPSHGGPTVSSAVSSIKTFFPAVYPKKTSTLVNAFIITFVTFTLLLAFNSFPISVAPSAASPDGYTSSIFSFNFTESISRAGYFNLFALHDSNFTINTTLQSPTPENLTPVTKNRTLTNPVAKNKCILSNKPSRISNHHSQTKHAESSPNKAPNMDKYQALETNQTAIPASKPSGSDNLPGNSTNSPLENQEIESLKNCEFCDGEWVKDDSYPLYKPGSCNLIDEQFNCFSNGRPDSDFQKLKWKPKKCTLPRLNGTKLLEMIRGRRLVFVGDSLNRNMWESLVCILKGSVKDESQVFEVNGRHQFRREAEFSFVFKDYDCTVEFFVSPFLVREWEIVDKNGTKKETLRLDLMGKSSEQYKGADIVIFNTGHWWTHEKTSKGEDYYQVGSYVYPKLDVDKAFRIALTTWGRWVDKNVNPKRSLVFFRGYSPSHFSGGQWNSGGACDDETEPIKNQMYLTPYPYKMEVLESVLKGMKTPVTYLNITRLTDYRKDAHPSVYRKQKLSVEESKSPLLYQDCSHWCLPGVPDSWNEILYAELLVKLRQIGQK